MEIEGRVTAEGVEEERSIELGISTVVGEDIVVLLVLMVVQQRAYA